MAATSGHALAARLRAAASPLRPGYRDALQRGARLAGLLLAGSLLVSLLLVLAAAAGGRAVVDPLDWPALAHQPTVPATWSFVVFESSLLPHALPRSEWSTWGAGCLLLTAGLLARAFSDGRQAAHGPLGVLLMIVPSAAAALLVALADAASGGDGRQLPLALLVALPLAGAVLAGAGWRALRERRSAAPVLRGLMAAAFALPLAVTTAGLAVLLAPPPEAPAGPWYFALLPFAPNAVLRGALDGAGTANSAGLVLIAVSATVVAIHLSRRSITERAAYAAGFGGLLAAATAVSTPEASAGAAWHVLAQSLPAGLVAGIFGAALGPYLGLTRFGHRLGSAALLRALGDRLPAPDAAEIQDVATIALPAPARLRTPRSLPTLPSLPTLRISGHSAGRLAVGVAAGLAVLLAATVAFTVLSTAPPNDGAPESAVAAAYLRAAGAGDAARAWDLLAVDADALPPAAGTQLLGRDDLARMYAVAGSRPGAPEGLRLDLAGRDGSALLLRARYTDSLGAHDAVLPLIRRGAGYRVLMVPAGISLPPGAVARVTIDGTAVPAGAYPVAVLPGVHEVTVAYPAPFAGGRAVVVADLPYAQPSSVPLGARLDDAALAAARDAVGSALRSCMTASAAQPAGCPQATDAPSGVVVHWTLVGDPAQSLVVLPDERGGATAHGQFQAVGAYDVHVPDDVKHVAAGGAFRAPLSWTGGRWSVAGAVVPDGAQLARPAVADQALVEAVRAGFKNCLATPLLRPADCPQSAPSQFFVRDVSWRLLADPLSGAAVAFDSRRGVLVVTGTFAMTAAFVEGGDPRAAQSSGPYRAELFWDGRQPVLVAINRA